MTIGEPGLKPSLRFQSVGSIGYSVKISGVGDIGSGHQSLLDGYAPGRSLGHTDRHAAEHGGGPTGG